MLACNNYAAFVVVYSNLHRKSAMNYEKFAAKFSHACGQLWCISKTFQLKITEFHQLISYICKNVLLHHSHIRAHTHIHMCLRCIVKAHVCSSCMTDFDRTNWYKEKRISSTCFFSHVIVGCNAYSIHCNVDKVSLRKCQ